jgi:hypothetical protein
MATRAEEHGLVLYGKEGCHLCEEMKAVLLPLCARFGVQLHEVDIAGDPELERRYGQSIPVLVLGQREVARHRLRDAEMSRLMDGLSALGDDTRRIR